MVSTLEQMQVQNGKDQVSGGVIVLCWLAAPVAMFYGNLQNLVIREKGRDLTQSCDKSPYTSRNVKRAK